MGRGAGRRSHRRWAGVLPPDPTHRARGVLGARDERDAGGRSDDGSFFLNGWAGGQGSTLQLHTHSRLGDLTQWGAQWGARVAEVQLRE